jgi:hypothetical protein
MKTAALQKLRCKLAEDPTGSDLPRSKGIRGGFEMKSFRDPKQANHEETRSNW